MIRLAVRCAPELAEAVLAELVVLAPAGVEERAGDGWVEYAIYGAEGELPDLGEVEAAAGEGIVAVESTVVPDDWGVRWREHHRPIELPFGLRVRPPWEPAADAAIELVIDPGRAFGTGAHPTTRLSLLLLAELAAAGAAGALADWGTGSGVLAIAAARMGFSPVIGCDSERAALSEAQRNAAANDVELRLERCDVRAEPPPLAPTVVANLTGPLLLAAARRIESPPRHLVCSGLLATEADEIAAAFGAAGLQEAVRRRDGEWGALLLASDG